MKINTISKCIGNRVLMERLLSAFLLFFTLGIFSAEAQSNGDYRSAQNGSWNQSGSWERFDGAAWVAAGSAPAKGTTVTIQANHSIGIIFQALVISGNLVIEDGGMLYSGFLGSFSIGPSGMVEVETGGFLALTAGFLSSPDVSVEGELNINGGTVICRDFTGAGVVSMTAGELEISGTVNPDATIEISGGTVAAESVTVEDGQRFSPADTAVGLVTVNGNMTFSDGSIYSVDLGSDKSCDELIVSNTLTIAMGASLEINGTLPAQGQVVAVSSYPIVGEFENLGDGEPVPGQAGFYIHYGPDPDGSGLYHITINRNPDSASPIINLEAYQVGDQGYVEFIDYDVEEDGFVDLKLQDENGKTIWSGWANIAAGPKAVARFKVPGLKGGDHCDFLLNDQAGKLWAAPDVAVKKFKPSMTPTTRAKSLIRFESLPDRDYEIQWAANMGSAWQTVSNLTASSEQVLSIEVEYPDPVNPSGFFRIVLK